MDAIRNFADHGVVKVVAGGLFTLLVAFVGYQLQLGGRRRRRRKEIREELELVALLGDRPEAVRLRARAEALLKRYAPEPTLSGHSAPSHPPWWVQLLSIAASTLASAFVSIWVLALGAVGFLLAVIMIGFVLQGVQDNRVAGAAERAASE